MFHRINQSTSLLGWEDDHLRLVVTASDTLTREQVSEVSSVLCKVGCSCVSDEPKEWCISLGS